MKKFFAFVLVMAVTTIASANAFAGLILTDMGTGEVITDGYQLMSGNSIQISLGADAANVSYDITIEGGAFDTSAAAFTAGWMFGNGFTGTPTAAAIKGSASNFMTDVAAGSILVSDIVLTSPDMASVSFVETTTGVDNAVSFSVVPEPMTMSLLGLGGLVAARRRRA